MKTKTLVLLCAGTVLAFALSSSTLSARAICFRGQASTPKISEGEQKALSAINAAPDAAAKLTLAEEFSKKYPKSTIRTQVATQLAGDVAKVADATQKVALAERLQKSFSGDAERVIVQPVLIDAYLGAKRNDDAFTAAAAILAKDPDDIQTLIRMTIVGTEEAKTQNGKHVPVAMQYGVKAIELIEANKKQPGLDDSSWANSKAMLPQMYQETAILALVSGKKDDAKTRVTKAISMNPNDPSSHAFLAYLLNDEYIQQATTFKSMPEGKQKEEMFKTLEGMLDSIIDSYAHAIGLATGKPEYQPLVQQLTPDLTSYYKFRHNQSAAGLQELIDKYKPQP